MSELTTRTEKIASAVYLITSFFDDKEPLKWRLRMLSNDLVSQSLKDKYSIAKEVAALFSIAKTAGLISDQNYEILVRELSKLEENTLKSLNSLLIEEPRVENRTLPEPAKTESVKDKTIDPAPESKPTLKEFGAVSVKKNNRQSIIIGLLKRKKEIMIKDVSPLISGCSEKTIQRELSAMVQSGILKKIGEKRWSRYTLA